MKKIILLFFLVVNLGFSLEITSVDPLDFGVAIMGDSSISLTNVGVYVKGKSGKSVEIIVPELYDLEGNNMRIQPRKRVIKLNNAGRGKFRLDVKLELNNIRGYETITNDLYITVRYVD